MSTGLITKPFIALMATSCVIVVGLINLQENKPDD